VFFANEEAPFFGTEEMGSRAYAKRCASREENIVAMLSVDSIGFFADGPGTQAYPKGMKHSYPHTGDFVAFISDENYRFRADSAKGVFSRDTDLASVAGQFPGLESDEWAFAQAGFPAVLATDTARFRYRHFHKPSDTFEKIDFERFEKACQGLKMVIDRWANP
jgi:hypothetical protein